MQPASRHTSWSVSAAPSRWRAHGPGLRLFSRLCILQDAHRMSVLGVWPQMVGQQSAALLAVFRKPDKKGGGLWNVSLALKEQPCTWGNALR
ncbi:hypothetical protein OAO87_02930 [bacterium]|nr:hypothetical protein [bacterium]